MLHFSHYVRKHTYYLGIKVRLGYNFLINHIVLKGYPMGKISLSGRARDLQRRGQELADGGMAAKMMKGPELFQDTSNFMVDLTDRVGVLEATCTTLTEMVVAQGEVTE
jgi:hypothetical protein